MAQYSVYTGQWTDWSQGPILGTKLTLNGNSSNILIASIATLNALVSAVAWTILSSVFFRIRAHSKKPKNGLFHQTQALLRNSQSPISFAFDVSTTIWSWRRLCSSSDLIASVSLAVPALVIFLGFNLAALLLSQISTTGEVLLRSTICGQTNLRQLETLSASQKEKYSLVAGADVLHNYVAASAYAQFCYNSENIGVSGPGAKIGATGPGAEQSPAANCAYYVRQALNWTTTYPDRCPFNGLCAVPDSEVVRLDTGRMDSNDDFGINAEPKNRIQMRRVTTCSPINTEGHSSNGFVHDTNADSVALYYFGINLDQKLSNRVPGSRFIKNSTFVYDSFSYNATNQAYEILIASESLYDANGGIAYNATDALYTGPGIVTLLFLANRAYYKGRGTTDPWFNATTRAPSSFGKGVPYFRSKNPGSILGCIEELEVCNPVNGNCARISPNQNPTEVIDLDKIQFNGIQTATASILYTVFNAGSLGALTRELGSRFLNANSYLESADIASLPLPDNQWQHEVQNAQAISMAFLQRYAFEYIGAPTNPAFAAYITPFEDKNANYLCSNQKFRNPAYSSFSILALGLIFGIDGLVIIVYLCVKILPTIQQRKGKAKHQRESWAANEILQLHRGVYQQLGIGTWQGDIYSIPTTRELEKFDAFTGLTAPVSETSHNDSVSTGQLYYSKEIEGAYGLEETKGSLSRHRGEDQQSIDGAHDRYVDGGGEDELTRASIDDITEMRDSPVKE